MQASNPIHVEVKTHAQWEEFVVNDGRGIRIELAVTGTAKAYRRRCGF